MPVTMNHASAVKSIEQILRQEYDRGFADGARALAALEMKVASLFAEAIKGSFGLNNSVAHAEPEKAAGPKAPKGAVGKAITDILRVADEGLSVSDIEMLCADHAPDVAPRSIGNELRRMEGKKYRREGRLWFLISRPETETAEGALESASAA